MRLYKKIILLAIVLLFIRSVIHDLSVGTFSEQTIPNESIDAPSNEEQTNIDPSYNERTESNNVNNKEPFQTVTYTVQAGDTVLSIAEEMNEVNVPIQQLLDDFEILNPGSNPHEIHIGETYYFPIYDKE